MNRRTILITTTLLAHVTTAPVLAEGTTVRVNVGPGGVQANSISVSPSLSADGRFVAFGSAATNLVPATVSGRGDIFVRDRKTGTNEVVSVGPGRVAADDWSFGPVISADGRFVAFASLATNLVLRDTNDLSDVFVHDRRTGRTTRINVGPRGAQDNGGAAGPALSADGRFVTFGSDATNLVPTDTNGQADIFLRDRRIDITTRISVGRRGVQSNGSSSAPSISANGRFIAFYSDATNLVPGDTNGLSDIFVHDRRTGATTRVSVGPRGRQANRDSVNPAISANGRFVVFESGATNLVPDPDLDGQPGVFLHDRQTEMTELVSVGLRREQNNSDATAPAISADGRFVTFESLATNLVRGDTNNSIDIFLRDRLARTTERVSVGQRGNEANEDSNESSISADGRVIAFQSVATNLVPRDTNKEIDIFVRTR